VTESDSDLEVWGECFLSFSHVSVTRLSNSKQKTLGVLDLLERRWPSIARSDTWNVGRYCLASGWKPIDCYLNNETLSDTAHLALRLLWHMHTPHMRAGTCPHSTVFGWVRSTFFILPVGSSFGHTTATCRCAVPQFWMRTPYRTSSQNISSSVLLRSRCCR